MAEKLSSAKDFRALAEDELKAHLEKLHQELWGHKLKTKDGSLTQNHRLRILKRQISRANTIIRERSLSTGKN